jgi:hypothetical protein
LLFATDAAKAAAQRSADGAARFRHGLVVVENEARDTPLDRAKGQAEAPSNQILRYLKRSDGIAGSTVRWGLLTNGRFWRLYSADVLERDERFFEIELAALLGDLPPEIPAGADAQHWARVFRLIFSADGFIPDAQGRCFVELCIAEGRRFEERITDRLSDTVFKGVFPALVEALAEGDPARAVADPAWRTQVKEAALILLFRFLFVLYAEDRGLLPVESAGYLRYSFRRLRDEAEEVADGEGTAAARGTTWWARIKTLFDAIGGGSTELQLPEYNGGLFDDALHPLLARVSLSDATLARLLDALSRADVAGVKRRINYRDLSVQQLGTIYERLLERDVIARGEGVATTENDTARHRTGSFFTTQKLVELIIARAVGPLLEEIRAAFAAKVEALRDDRRRAAQKLEDLRRFDPASAFTELRICDPAMGSGHFLVSLVDYLAVETLAAMAASADALPGYRSPLALHIESLRIHLREEAALHGWQVREEHLDDRALLRRVVLKRCVYGVDLNPLAVELAKLSLWLHCFTVGAPLSFLDHHLRAGDSLLGERVGHVLAELRDDYKLAPPPIGVESALNAASGMAIVEGLTDADIVEVRRSKTAFADVESMTADLRRFLDIYHARRWVMPGAEESGVAAFFGGAYGDPVGIIAGTVAPRGPNGEGGNGRQQRARDAFAAFGTWLKRASAMASERRLLHWQAAFPGVWREWSAFDPPGGFDAVIGNPPYVRQEQIKAIKPALKLLYGDVFDGVADLYVYFYEQGLRLLRRGGRLSFVVTNKWLKAGYAEKLRLRLGRDAWMETAIDFGHCKHFFPDADVMPCVIVARRPDPRKEAPPDVAVSVIPRDVVDLARLGEQVTAATFFIRRENLARAEWMLEPPDVSRLMAKLRQAGLPLREYVGASPMYGIKTGYNEAFLIDGARRETLIANDPASEHVIKPYLRGQDINRWRSVWNGQWIILIESSANRAWPWSAERIPAQAERIFAARYPAIHDHFSLHREALEARQDQGRYFWELRECSYYDNFSKPKILYQEIQYHPSYAIDRSGALVNNKCFFLPTDDLWLLAQLNSPLMWWHNWRTLGHAKDEALTPQAFQMETIPITQDARSREQGSKVTGRLLAVIDEINEQRRILRNWYRLGLDLQDIPMALRDPFGLEPDQFVAAIRDALPARRRRLSAADSEMLRNEHETVIVPARRKLAEARQLERALSDLVNEAYGLTAEDIDLMWRTAPPRMPIPDPRPAGSARIAPQPPDTAEPPTPPRTRRARGSG